MRLAKAKIPLRNLVLKVGQNLTLGSYFQGRVFSSAFKRHGSTGEMRLVKRRMQFSNWVLAFGDSLTAGSYFNGSVFAPYSIHLQKLLRLEDQFKDVVVHENGISGRTGGTHSAPTTCSSLLINWNPSSNNRMRSWPRARTRTNKHSAAHLAKHAAEFKTQVRGIHSLGHLCNYTTFEPSNHHGLHC